MEININYICGAFVEIKDDNKNNENEEYLVQFIDMDKNSIIHQQKIKSNHWVRTSRRWYTNWKINIYNNNRLIKQEIFNIKDHVVRINIVSLSLGDNLAWVPYVEEFRKKYDLKKVICSTNFNYLFQPIYKNIDFTDTKRDIKEVTARYDISYFDEDLLDNDGWLGYTSPFNPYKQNMQKAATDILGLEYSEIKPDIFIDKKIKRDIYLKGSKYVCISEHSTAKAKYWNNSNGWQELVDYLNKKGYKVVCISKEPTTLRNVVKTNGNMPLNYRIKQLYHAEFFVGVGSGLAWLAWAIGKDVVMISGFSEPFTEFSLNNIRVFNSSVCTGCFNKHVFDKGDWEWCPEHKNTPRQFECTKSITSQMVIDKIEKEIFNKETTNRMVEIPVPNAEVVDRLTILDIKMDNIKDNIKLKNIKKEYDYLFPLLEDINFKKTDDLYLKLLDVNRKIWLLEDQIREKINNGLFDDEYLDISKEVHKYNEERSFLKKIINLNTKSPFIEEKSYMK